MSFSFAINNSCNIPSIRVIVRSVKTKKWAKLYRSKLEKYHDRLTNAKRDDQQIIGGILQAAYGYNIGNQVLELLTPEDLQVIRKNIIFG